MDVSKLCLYSYNSRGSNDSKLDYIKSILSLCGNNVPIFCMQEHFLLKNNLRKLSAYFNDFAVLSKPAIKDFNIQCKGRPKGGLATIVPKYLRKSIELISTNVWRIQPMIIKSNNSRLLLINCYFPTDLRILQGECHDLEECLMQISSIIESVNFTDLRIVGDLNFDNLRNSVHANAIRKFMDSKNICSLWEFNQIDFTYVFESENGLFAEG